MQLLSTLLLPLLLATSTLAQDDSSWDREISSGRKSLSGRSADALGNPLAPRVTQFGSGKTCADAFGPGNLPCGSGSDCYNPAAGETCCTNGKYCPAGQKCSSGGGCTTGSSSSGNSGPDSAPGATCADAFGPTFIRCGSGSGCYDPTAGESCCSNGKYCPAGSSCLSGGGCSDSSSGNSIVASATAKISSIVAAATSTRAFSSYTYPSASSSSGPGVTLPGVTALATGLSGQSAGTRVLSPVVAVVVGAAGLLGFLL